MSGSCTLHSDRVDLRRGRSREVRRISQRAGSPETGPVILRGRGRCDDRVAGTQSLSRLSAASVAVVATVAREVADPACRRCCPTA